MIFGQFLHPTEHQRAKVVQDVRQQDELLRIKQRCVYIVEELGALNGDSHAGDFVLLLPELGHLLVETLELLREILGGD
jgi:hypothetical protein